MVHIDEDGRRTGSPYMPVNTAGFIVHTAIRRARQDINAACHIHALDGIA